MQNRPVSEVSEFPTTIFSAHTILVLCEIAKGTRVREGLERIENSGPLTSLISLIRGDCGFPGAPGGPIASFEGDFVRRSSGGPYPLRLPPKTVWLGYHGVPKLLWRARSAAGIFGLWQSRRGPSKKCFGRFGIRLRSTRLIATATPPSPSPVE
jgi:hypothetical protein